MTEEEQAFVTEELTVSYVILLGNEGNVPMKVDPQKLSRAFGNDLGLGNFAALPNGYVVQLGPSNQLLFQPPKVIFQGASERILLELYKNSRDMVVGGLPARASKAFGVNFQINAKHNKLKPSEVFRKLTPQYFPKNSLMEGAKFKQKLSVEKRETNFSMEPSATDPEAVFFSINNNISDPTGPHLSPEDLATEIKIGRENYKNFLEELNRCLHPHQ